MTYDGREGTSAPWDADERELPRHEPWHQPRYDPVAHQQRIDHERQQAWQSSHPQPTNTEPTYVQPTYTQPDYTGPGYPPPPPPWGQPPQGQATQGQSPYGQPPRQQWPQQPTRQRSQRPRRKRHVVRNILAGIGGLVVLIIVIAAATSGNHTISTSGTSTGGTAGGGSTKNNPAKTAGIGSAITLSGNSSGEQMSVTVTKVIASAQPGDEFTSAPAGDRLYAVQFRLRDTGSAAYSDAPSNGAAVVDANGQSYDAAIADTAAGCTTFPPTENIAPGSAGLGCIVFEVPKSATIKDVQFTLDSGLGPDTGQWDVMG
jgi:Domain of unknown function (DUF4352)